ncbi:hypothetical protein LCGC14_2051140, partial [marine sediment metagenome]
MNNSKFRRNKRIFFLLAITMTISFLYFDQFFLNSNHIINSTDSFVESEVIKELKTSSYPQTFEDSGENMNITLHQSYLDTSFDTILNTSIVNGNNFTLPSPTDVFFNSTFTNITVKDIIASNKTIIYEDDGIQAEQVFSFQYAVSFRIPGTGYIENVSLNLFNDADVTSSNLRLRVYKSQWNVGGYSEPDTLYGTLMTGVAIENYDGWYKFSSLGKLLNVSETSNNTFFIGLKDFDDDTYWYFDYDGTGSVDSIDDLDSFYESTPDNWILYNPLSRGSDFQLKCDFIPLNNTPNPEDIGLKINGKKVNGYANINGSGYWESFDVNSSGSGILKYNVSADWWDVECNITQVQINYTRTDLRAISSFQIPGSGLDVAWNVTRNGGFNNFGTDFNNYRINFSIPATWHSSSIKVFNGTDQFSIKKRLLGNGYREVEVLNAINGSYWFLNATSDNEIASIETNPTSIFNYSDIVYFNATFLNFTNDGIINLSVYSPAAINNKLNYSFINSSFGAGLEVYFGNWNISESATKYGIFRIQVKWNNNDSAGFRESTIIINAETSLEILYPMQNVNYDASRIFNMTIRYNDTGQNLNISDADIQYKINDGAYSTI